MLEGKGALYLPPHDSNRIPVEYSARCLCGRRYLIFNPGAHSLGDAEGRARERAEAMRCRFVNSSMDPFLTCPCGQALDFSTALEALQVM